MRFTLDERLCEEVVGGDLLCGVYERVGVDEALDEGSDFLLRVEEGCSIEDFERGRFRHGEVCVVVVVLEELSVRREEVVLAQERVVLVVA